MRAVTALALLVLAAVGAAGCATRPAAQPSLASLESTPAPKLASASAEETCRNVVSTRTDASRQEAVYCGTARQWADFDRRAQMVNAGVTCDTRPGVEEMCLTPEQWKQYDRQQRAYAQTGWSAGNSRAAAGDMPNAWENPAMSPAMILMPPTMQP